MTREPDIRGFYADLGIDLPGCAHANVTVRCFADPGAHAHEDRNASCSVSLEHGAWRCWACGASGGAYDAALTRGHSPGSAIELMARHQLVERRTGDEARALRTVTPGAGRAQPAVRRARRERLAATEIDVREWHRALFSAGAERVRQLLTSQRLWLPAVMRELEVGYDCARITIPIRDASDALRGVLRYRPRPPGPKMLATRGTRLGLIPHPSRDPSSRLLLVEGPPDMIAARSRGWHAIAVPSDHAWRSTWAGLLAGREVTVVMDSDAAGRQAARRIAADLKDVCPVRVVDLAPSRTDGFDLTDWLRQQPRQRRRSCTPFSSSRRTITR